MIDLLVLSKFASENQTRTGISRPWSRGKFTYATDGHILVRVPMIPGVEDNDAAPASVEKTLR